MKSRHEILCSIEKWMTCSYVYNVGWGIKEDISERTKLPGCALRDPNTVMHTCKACAGACQWISRDDWQATVAKRVHSKSSKRPCLKKKVGGVLREIPQLYPLASTHGHNCVQPHKHTHKNLPQYLTLHHIIKTVFFLYRKCEEKYITKNLILGLER